MQIDDSVYLSDRFQAKGTVRLPGATIGGNLECDGATFRNPDGNALTADGMQVTGSVFLRNRFHAEGTVRLNNVTIGSTLDCDGATFHNPDGNALTADGMQVTGGVFFRNQFQAEGEVLLLDVTIGGALSCIGGSFRNPNGDALSADRIQVDGSVFLSDQFQAEGTVRLPSARIGSQLSCRRGTFRNPDGCALFGKGLVVDRELVWHGVSDVNGELSLVGAHLRALTDDVQSWQFADMTYNLQGLRIDRFIGSEADWTWRQRKDWLDAADYSGPGPYEMVARWYRSVGKDRHARHLDISGQDARRDTLPSWRKPFHWSWRQLAGYGYQPWRTVVFLLVAFYLFGLLVFSRFAEMTLARKPEVYAFNRWVYTADVVVPLVDLRQASQWAPTDTLGLWTMWGLIVAGWGLSLALVAAVSGLYTKD
jgi:hypothetical protein